MADREETWEASLEDWREEERLRLEWVEDVLWEEDVERWEATEESDDWRPAGDFGEATDDDLDEDTEEASSVDDSETDCKGEDLDGEREVGPMEERDAGAERREE